VFYVFFAIRFINYAHRFHVIEAAMEADVPEDDDRQQVLLPAVAGNIEERLNRLTDAKLYLSPSIKIEEVAQRIGTNYKYLSTYIRIRKEKTFNQWGNELCIEEAKHLLAEYPDMAVSEIAFKVGFVNRSHFSRTFLALAKSSPKTWRASLSAINAENQQVAKQTPNFTPQKVKIGCF
jgi:AraC-like DNA-binding protein